MLVRLGAAEFEVIDQPHAYLTNHLPSVMQAAIAAKIDWDGDEYEIAVAIARALGDGVYDVLCVFYPETPERPGLKSRMPRHEFLGFASVAAMEAGEYDESAARRTPTFPQIVTAIEAAIEVNGGEYFRKVFGFFDPKLLRAVITERMTASLLKRSASSPSMNGESALTSSGVSAPRAAEMIEGSPSLV